MNKGNLLPDSLILRVIREHFMKAHSEGTDRFLLDGFPRTREQAAALEQIADVKLAVNLGLREEVRVLRMAIKALNKAALGAMPQPNGANGASRASSSPG